MTPVYQGKSLRGNSIHAANVQWGSWETYMPEMNLYLFKTVTFFPLENLRSHWLRQVSPNPLLIDKCHRWGRSDSAEVLVLNTERARWGVLLSRKSFVCLCFLLSSYFLLRPLLPPSHFSQLLEVNRNWERLGMAFILAFILSELTTWLKAV